MNPPIDPTLWLLQANDSSYPSGAYAHSLGLEEMVACGHVTTPADLSEFLHAEILPALLAFELPFFGTAHRAANDRDTGCLLALDEELDAWRLPHEIREASRRIGSQRLELLATLDPSPFVQSIRECRPRAHHLIVTAIELSVVPLAHAARAFAYQAIAAYCAASMKLIRIGQTACQRTLRQVLSDLGPRIDESLAAEPEGWFNPLLEIASLRHARSHARLFIS